MRYGKPQRLRSDNGPEFIAYAIHDWLKKNEIKTIYISPVARGRTVTSKASTTEEAEGTSASCVK